MGKVSLTERAVVLGANGVVGRALASKLIESGISVTGLDLQEEACIDAADAMYLQCDATAPTDAGLRKIAEADTVVICLPEEAGIAALPPLVRDCPADCLIVDTLSVKEKVVATFGSLHATQEYLSINPMFSPSLGFSGQNVAVVPVNGGPRALEFESLLASWGAATVHVEADEHDRITALLQVATHAAIMSLGLVLHEWDYDVAKAIRMATPPHRTCLALLARMTDAAPEVYWDIQRSNTYGSDARGTLLDKTKLLSDAIEEGEEERFRELMSNMAEVTEPLKDELLHCANSICAASSL